jgi:hypothetical protein
MAYLSVTLATIAIVLWVPTVAALACLWRRDRRHAEHLEQLDEGIARAFGRDDNGGRPRLHIVRGGRYLAAVIAASMPGWWRHVRDHPGAATVATIVASFAIAAPVLFPSPPAARPSETYAQPPVRVVPPMRVDRVPQPRPHPSAGPTPVRDDHPAPATPEPRQVEPEPAVDDTPEPPRQGPDTESDDPSPPAQPEQEPPPTQEPRLPDDDVADDCAVKVGRLVCVELEA